MKDERNFNELNALYAIRKELETIDAFEKEIAEKKARIEELEDTIEDCNDILEDPEVCCDELNEYEKKIDAEHLAAKQRIDSVFTGVFWAAVIGICVAFVLIIKLTNGELYWPDDTYAAIGWIINVLLLLIITGFIAVSFHGDLPDSTSDDNKDTDGGND